MSIKCILVPLSGTPSDAVVSSTAILIAKKFGSEIQALYAQRPAALEASRLIAGADDSISLELYDVLRAEAEKSEIQVRETFQQILKGLNSDSTNNVTALLDVAEGSAAEAIIERGGAYDLLVVARPGVAEKGQAREMAEAALFHTGRQVLLTPAVVPQAVGDRVLIAWNRSAQAGRAVAQAMPFLERAKHVSIFHVQTGAKPGPSPGRLKHYLGLHEVDSEITEIAPDHRTVGEQILDQAHDDEADLIVMGAYSKSRLRERLLGGVTQFVFSTADIPVLMTR